MPLTEPAAKRTAHDRVRDCLNNRYPGATRNTVMVREFLQRICGRHIDLGLGDADLADKLCSDDNARFWQQLSEVLLGHELLEAGLALTPSRNGPDFVFERDGLKIWIEVICPLPTGIPGEWLAPPAGKAFNYPHEAILLRWTAAIKEKAEKLLGNSGTGQRGYLDKGTVGKKDVYVIAVNACLLRGPYFPSITGISQCPYAVEAAFSVGPLTLRIDRTTLKSVGSEHQHRPFIKKSNGADVPAYTFLDPAFRAVSAIWATDVTDAWVFGNGKPMAVVHNPEAINPLPVGLLPCYDEFIATPAPKDEYELGQRPGRLKQATG